MNWRYPLSYLWMRYARKYQLSALMSNSIFNRHESRNLMTDLCTDFEVSVQFVMDRGV